MKIIEQTFGLATKKTNEFIDITTMISQIVTDSNISQGDVIIFCPHTTAGITINENADPDVVRDMLLTLEKLVPRNNPNYRHSEGNSDAHLKSSLIGTSEQIIITDGKLALGSWQGLYFCEFDGPRNRTVFVQVRGL